MTDTRRTHIPEGAKSTRSAYVSELYPMCRYVQSGAGGDAGRLAGLTIPLALPSTVNAGPAKRNHARRIARGLWLCGERQQGGDRSPVERGWHALDARTRRCFSPNYTRPVRKCGRFGKDNLAPLRRLTSEARDARAYGRHNHTRWGTLQRVWRSAQHTVRVLRRGAPYRTTLQRRLGAGRRHLLGLTAKQVWAGSRRGSTFVERNVPKPATVAVQVVGSS